MEVRAWLYSQICLYPPSMTNWISLSTFYNLKKKKSHFFTVKTQKKKKKKNQNLVKSKYLNKFNPANLIPKSKKERKENLYQW